MDIGTSDCDVLLLVEDLDKLKPVLCQAQAKWYELGTKLGFSPQVLHKVEEDQRVNAGEGTGFMSALLEGWGKSLDPALPSWAHLIKCLRDVEEHDVAKAVEELAPKVVAKETQKAIMEPLLQQEMVKGETWYLVHAEWIKNWKRFVNFDYFSYSQPNPGPVNTVDLLRDGQLKDFMSDGTDFVLLPEPAWEKLVSWYGLSQGSIPIPRKVVEYDIHVKGLKVEISLIELCLCMEDDSPEKAVNKMFSRSTTVGELEATMRDIFQVPNGIRCVLRTFYHDLLKPAETLGELSIHSREKIVLRRTSSETLESSTEPSPPEHHVPRWRLHEDAKPVYPPHTFDTFDECCLHVKHQGTSSPRPVTWFTNREPIMVDARKDVKTLTWPADPFDPTKYTLNTTAYFNIVKVRDQPLTYKFYTPAFEQYAVAGNQKYVLAVVEQGTGSGSYGVKFVNEASPECASIFTDIILEDYPPKAAEATVIGATSTCTDIILEDYLPKAGDAKPVKKSVSMHVKVKNNKVYLSPGKTSNSKDFVTTSPNPASFVIKFYPSTI